MDHYWNGMARPGIARRRPDASDPAYGNDTADIGSSLLRSPSSLEGMLRTSTETGDIGLFTIEPAYSSVPCRRRRQRSSESVTDSDILQASRLRHHPTSKLLARRGASPSELGHLRASVFRYSARPSDPLRPGTGSSHPSTGRTSPSIHYNGYTRLPPSRLPAPPRSSARITPLRDEWGSRVYRDGPPTPDHNGSPGYSRTGNSPLLEQQDRGTQARSLDDPELGDSSGKHQKRNGRHPAQIPTERSSKYRAVPPITSRHRGHLETTRRWLSAGPALPDLATLFNSMGRMDPTASQPGTPCTSRLCVSLEVPAAQPDTPVISPSPVSPTRDLGVRHGLDRFTKLLPSPLEDHGPTVGQVRNGSCNYDLGTFNDDGGHASIDRPDEMCTSYQAAQISERPARLRIRRRPSVPSGHVVDPTKSYHGTAHLPSRRSKGQAQHKLRLKMPQNDGKPCRVAPQGTVVHCPALRGSSRSCPYIGGGTPGDMSTPPIFAEEDVPRRQDWIRPRRWKGRPSLDVLKAFDPPYQASIRPRRSRASGLRGAWDPAGGGPETCPYGGEKRHGLRRKLSTLGLGRTKAQEAPSWSGQPTSTSRAAGTPGSPGSPGSPADQGAAAKADHRTISFYSRRVRRWASRARIGMRSCAGRRRGRRTQGSGLQDEVLS